jgi:hypothetical protein
MENKTLVRLLNTSLDLLISLEQFADETTQKDIDALFDEVNFNDDMLLDDNILADLQAQDYDEFGENKI